MKAPGPIFYCILYYTRGIGCTPELKIRSSQFPRNGLHHFTSHKIKFVRSIVMGQKFEFELMVYLHVLGVRESKKMVFGKNVC